MVGEETKRSPFIAAGPGLPCSTPLSQNLFNLFRRFALTGNADDVQPAFKHIKLNEIIATGTVLDADLSAELLKNIFFVKAPLHDGAVVVRGGRITAAGCVLPLTSSPNISKDLGMRHRAGIGMSERSDAVVIIVSEETGAISCAIDGMLKRHLKPQVLEKILRKELLEQKEEEEEPNFFLKLGRKLFASEPEEEEENEGNL